jgi:hypothetical protein
MIHVRTQTSAPEDGYPNPVIHISLVGIADIAKFKTDILDRALNCADPHKNKTWVELSDGLEKFIRNANTAKP